MNFEGNQQSLLTFRVGPVLCCAPSFPVRSIISPPKLTHLPGSDLSQPGIFKHGSHIVKVFDLRQKFGIDDAEQTQPGNLIVTIFEDGSFAFWVDQILDVFDFPTEGWGNVPAAIPRGVFTKTLLLNKKIHLYSEFEKLATINDLGYLKHYIQQLKQQDPIKEKIKLESTLSKTLHLSSTANEAIASPVVSPVKNDTTITTPSLKSDSKNTFKTPIQTVKPSVPLMKPRLDKKSDAVPTVKNTPAPRHPILKAATTNTVPKSTSQKPISQNTTRDVIKPTPSLNVKKSPQTQPKIDAPSTKTKITYVNKTDQEESSTSIIVFFLFMLCLLGVGFYYLFFDNDIKKPIIIEKYEPIKTKEVKPAVVEIPIINIVETNITKNEVEEKEIEVKKYKADITQQENEITITIHQPISEEEKLKKETLISEIENIEADTDVEISVSTTPVEKLSEKENTQELPKEKIISEVIHTVVKGDTLWAIAKKYVDNPFLYPELARLSNIKNPHRIYPGNRVRIRFIKN